MHRWDRNALDFRPFVLQLSDKAKPEQKEELNYPTVMVRELTLGLEARIKADFDTLGRWP
jgi:hypothetical protein